MLDACLILHAAHLNHLLMCIQLDTHVQLVQMSSMRYETCIQHGGATGTEATDKIRRFAQNLIDARTAATEGRHVGGWKNGIEPHC